MFFKIIFILYIGFIAHSVSCKLGTDGGNSITSSKPDAITIAIKGKCGFKEWKSLKSVNQNTTSDQGFRVTDKKFHKNQITYAISKYTTKISKPVIDSTIRRAFDTWSAIIPLNFTQKSPGKPGEVDIDIGFFVRKHHGADGDPADDFDGPYSPNKSRNILAHAILPYCDVHPFLHFDDDEDWTTNEGEDLFQVAVHEIGHNIGLLHTEVEDSVMYGIYTYKKNFKLHDVDVAGARFLYPPKKN